MPPGSSRSRAALLAVCLALAATGPAPPRDLDVAVPPGSPLEWASSFPAFTPPRRGLFPRTPGGDRGASPDDERTRSLPPGGRLDAGLGSVAGLTRVLTWDLAAHLEWIRMRAAAGPRTGASALLPARPAYGDALYWVSLAPLLRLLLHPDLLSRDETAAHLVEIGAWVDGVLDAAAAEKDLAPLVALVRARVAPRDTAAAVPLAPEADLEGTATTRARMLSRFVMEELQREHPYDPEGRFGARLFLLADEVLPWIERYAGSGASFLRRNAVAALARYRTRDSVEHLLALAASTADPVVLARATAALGRFRATLDWTPLVQRLQASDDPIERAELIGALGRVGCATAVPRILELGRQALDGHDADALIPILTALAGLRSGANGDRLAAFARDVLAAVARPRAFRRSGPPLTMKPDVPDAPDQLAEVLRQHALILLHRCRPDDPDVRAQLLALLDRGPLPSWAAGTEASGIQRYVGSRLARVVPSARFLFVEDLAFAGDAAAGDLALVAEDPRVEEAVRGEALAAMPAEQRIPRLVTLVGASGQDATMRGVAFALLVRESDGHVAELGHRLVAECAEQEGGAGTPEQRALWLAALRALDERGELGAAELAPLLRHVRAPLLAAGDRIDQARRLIEEACDLAAGGAIPDRVSEALRPAAELALASGLNPELTAESLPEHLHHAALQLAGLAKRAADADYRRLAVAAVLAGLFGTPVPDLDRSKGEFLPVVPLEEEIVLALGRTRAPQAVELLAQLLSEPLGRLHAHVALALAMAGEPSVAVRVARLLLDEDAFVRFAAAEAIRRLTGAAEDVDWMYGPSTERFAAAERLWARLQEKR